MVDSDLAERIVGGAFGLLIAVVIIGMLFTSVGGVVDSDRTTEDVGTIGDSGELPYRASNISVQQSLGDALALDGSDDAGLSAGDAIDIRGEAEVCTWTRLDATGNNATIAAADGQLSLRYAGNGSNEWVATYWNASDRTLYDVTAIASSPGTWTHLCARTNGSLTLAVNGTDEASTPLDGSHDADAATADYSPLDGRVDETRVYNSPLNASQRTALVDHPTRPLDSGATARVMYDATDSTPGTLPIYFTGEEASVNGQLVSGFDGEAVSSGDDYSIDGTSISLLDGGVLEGAPAVWLTYSAPSGPFVAIFQTAETIFGAVVVLASLGILALGARSAQEILDT